MFQTNDIIGTLTFSGSVGQCYIQVTSYLNMSQLGKFSNNDSIVNLKILKFCRPVLLSGKVQSEHVAAGEGFKQRYYQYINTIKTL